MRCRVATMIGCWLSAIRSTANAQPRCSMYRLPITKAIAANPTANRANTASSSHTKYICSKTSAARNVHIHFRLLSLVFIIPLSPDRCSVRLRLLACVLLPDLFTHSLRCATLSLGSNEIPCTCPICHLAVRNSDGTEDTFLV